MTTPTPRYTLWHIWDGYHAIIDTATGALWRGPDGSLQWHKPKAVAHAKALNAEQVAA